ncbi:MAG TPA: hypothetical protein VLK84_29090 [Longimicrobium sp.]|nr:hypothetical protein [Longimicrobium sp.]
MQFEQPTVHDQSDPSPLVDAKPAAVFGETSAELADDLLGESPPEHGWLGHGFIWGLYTLVPIQLAAGVYLLAAGWSFGAAAGMLPLILFFPLLYLWLARSIQTFKLTGWGVAMLVLLTALFSALRLLLGDPDGIQILTALATGALVIAWISYFWNRKPDFT